MCSTADSAATRKRDNNSNKKSVTAAVFMIPFATHT